MGCEGTKAKKLEELNGYDQHKHAIMILTFRVGLFVGNRVGFLDGIFVGFTEG